MNKKFFSVVDSYVASYIELCEFESKQVRFLQIFFFVYILFFYLLILSFALEHFLTFFYLFIILFFSLSFNIVSFFLSFINCHNNKFQSSSLDEDSVILMTNFSTSRNCS